MPPEPQKTPEETIALLTEVQKQRGDKFLVKLFKKKNAGGLFEWFADLADATAFHIASCEPWIHQLGGGGEYRLQAYHMDANTVPIGGRLPVVIPGAGYQYPLSNAGEMTSWCGPRTIVSLASATPQGAIGVAGTFQQPQQLPQPVQQGYGTPVQAQGNGAVVQPFPMYNVTPGAQHPFAQQYAQPSQTDQLRSQLEQKERELSARELRIERERAERESEVKRSESEQRLRAEADAKIRELSMKIEANNAALAAAAARPAADPGAWVKELVVALVPVATQLMTTAAQTREMQFKAQLEAQERADKRAAEDRAENRKILEAISAKPTGMTDETKILIETLRSQGSVAADFARQTMDATSVVTKNSLAMIETISAIKFGDEPESPVLLAIREAAAALKHLGVGGNNAARRAVQQQRPQLPYSAAATAPVPPAMPPIVPTNPAQVPVQRFDGVQTGGAAAQVAGPGQIPAPAEAAQQQPAQPALTLHEARQILQRGRPPNQFEDPLQVLELGVRAHHNPIEIATYFFLSVPHPKLHAALKEVGGEVDDLLRARLGLAWVNDPQNMPYVLQLGAVLEDMGIKLGVYQPEPEDDDGQDAGPEDDQIPPAVQTVEGN